MVRVALAEAVERQRADDRLLDGVVGQDPLDQAGQGLARALDAVGPDRPDALDREAEVPQELQGALGLGVGHARLGQHVDDGAALLSFFHPVGRIQIPPPLNQKRLNQHIRQDLAGRAFTSSRVRSPSRRNPRLAGMVQGPGIPSSAASTAIWRPAWSR